ncbi:hypothetical protein AVEN_183663-1 [Araneus ventricosus]|uniref:Uncharacterized protein n=1 Tax=Araneus ventricosus TaxID=182803 RepID=A0A4Y2LLP3_ARAVE|nr:hypothetical protein AVEN_44963-1 [Araneus ventricosus]GBN14257.1 hypothetical protein AVEN_183663-1 [Araneus ventricosus]
MDITTLERTLNSLKKKCDDLMNYAQTYEESLVEIEIKSKNCHCLQQKVEKLRKQYYELPGTTEISMEDEALYELEERLETLEIRFKVILEDLTSKREKAIKDNSENECSKSVKIKLPKIPLPIFDGKYEEWSSFGNQFMNLIANNDDLSDSEKLYYLRSSLKGEAKQVETEDDTFDSLFKALKERFENKKLIINAHVNAVMNFEKIQYASAKDLRYLLDNIRKSLRALKVLEYERNKLSDIVLLNILLPKLDKESKKLFESSLEMSDVPKLHNFLNFLEKRSLVIESISRDPGVKGSKNASLQPRRYQSFLTNPKSLPQEARKKCYLCGGYHKLLKCDTFLQLAVRDRYSVLRSHKLCLFCLKEKHMAAECRSKDSLAVSVGEGTTRCYIVPPNQGE